MQLMPKQKQYALVLVQGIACQSYPAFVHIMQATIMMHALQAKDYIGYVKERQGCMCTWRKMHQPSLYAWSLLYL